MGRVSRLKYLFWLSILVISGMFFLPAIPQNQSYHSFADRRELFGIPNFWNVTSNIPFLIVGVLGMVALSSSTSRGYLLQLRTLYVTFFVGAFLTGLGSIFYHWNPSNETLLWDRLPMTISFMAFLSIIIGEHIEPKIGHWLLWPFIFLGVSSVLYWYISELQGHGDLRPYIIVQFLPMLFIPLIMLLLPSRLSKVVYLWLVVAAYALSKVMELLDQSIFEALGAVGGHPLKHVTAAAGVYVFYLALKHRRRNESYSSKLLD
ncbi:MAG: ceramidase domain-containing protein [Candidatus Nitrosoglobus sp.]